MANIYVRSTDGNNSDNGSTWALAKATLAGADAIDAAGDTIWISQNHSESNGALLFLALAGTGASPCRVLCGDDSAEPPTSLATGGTIATTANNTMLFGVNTAYVYGLRLVAGDGTGGSNVTPGNASTGSVFEACEFYLRGTGASANVNITSGTKLIDCVFRASAAGHTIIIGPAAEIIGGSFHASTTSPSIVFAVGNSGNFFVDRFDFSNLSSTIDIVKPTVTSVAGTMVLRNCKLPASWSGALLNNATVSIGLRVEMYNCDSADTNYRLWVESYAGSIKSDTGIYNSAGASDGDTRISWKMVSSTAAEYPVLVLRTPELVQWNEVTGSSVTATVEVVLDSATALNDDDVWIEAQYLGTSGAPLGAFISDKKTDVLASAAAQDSSSASWTGTGGFSNEQKRKLSVTFTPQEKGFIHVVVCLAKASTTVYVDPLLTVN